MNPIQTLLAKLASFKYKKFNKLPEERSTKSILRQLKHSGPNMLSSKPLEDNEHIVMNILKSRKTDKERIKIIEAIFKNKQKRSENSDLFYFPHYLSALQEDKIKAESICQYIDYLVPPKEEYDPFSALQTITDLIATIKNPNLKSSTFHEVFCKLGANLDEREVFCLCEMIAALPEDSQKEKAIQNYHLLSYGTNFHFAQEIAQDLLPCFTNPSKKANLFLQLHSNCPNLRTNAMRLENDTERISTMKKICQFYMPSKKDENLLWQDFSLLRPIQDNNKKIEAIDSILASYLEKYSHTTECNIKQALESQMPEVASCAIDIFSPSSNLDISLLTLFKKYQNTVYTKSTDEGFPFIDSIKQKLSNIHLTNSLLTNVLKGANEQDAISFLDHFGLQSMENQDVIRQFHEPQKEETER